jgi:tetratricopeptide (TPR) repeat protein
MLLKLAISDYRDANHWYCRLLDANGNQLADHEVSLNPRDLEYEGLVDLRSFLRNHAAPDRRHQDEARLIAQVGTWIGRNVYGPIAGKILAAGTPSVVRVEIPPAPAEASGLLYLPWELGHAGGQPLALQDVSLVFEVQGESAPVDHQPVEGALRMLAVFSLPTDVNALNLRHERHRLARLIRDIAKQKHLAIDLRVLQYGATRDALRQILKDGDGWDILHFSGHGLQAHLVLEKQDGTKDLVSSEELLQLVKPARGRLKWVTLSACLSAAATVEETLLWLGVDPHRATPAVPAAQGAADRALPALARALVRDLDCAVLAMRYPVGDAFAIDLAEQLYQGVLDRRQTLPRALQLALPEAMHKDSMALSVATPALFGRQSAELKIQAPVAPAAAEPARISLAYFKERPGEQFVGRVRVLSDASQALAPNSPYAGVLFYGMAGGGKTACAVELAFHYEDLQRFTHFLWYHAPEADREPAGALEAFALAWETQLGELNPPSLVETVSAETARFDAFLPRLTEFLRQHSVLLVLDNLESLLRENGAWHEERWAKLIAAMLDHDGPSRVLLTSRVRPVPPDRHLLELTVHALSLNEAALLARQLPNLGGLLRDEDQRALVRRTLEVVQGHPKLLELAEKQASSAEALRAHLDRTTGASAAGQARLAAFFAEGETKLDAPEFLQTSGAWTRSITDSLTPEARAFFHFLCCLEEGDREAWIVAQVWPQYWKRLSDVGELPTIESCGGQVDNAGLVDVVENGYRIHPGVAEAGREQAGEACRAAADEEMAGFWQAGSSVGLGNEMQGGGPTIVRAGLGAAPYLVRRQEWHAASALLERVTQRDRSPGTLAAVLPLMRRVVGATKGSDKELMYAGVLAKMALGLGQAAEAERMMRQIVREAEQRSQFRLAGAVAGDLVSLLRETGRLREALDTFGKMKELTRLAGLGPWTRILGEVQRLQILNELGRYSEVLGAVEELRKQMQSLPGSGEAEESANPWNVRENHPGYRTHSRVGSGALAGGARSQPGDRGGHQISRRDRPRNRQQALQRLLTAVAPRAL